MTGANQTRHSAGAASSQGGKFAPMSRSAQHGGLSLSVDDAADDAASDGTELPVKPGDEAAFAHGYEWGEALHYGTVAEVRPGDSIATATGLYDVMEVDTQPGVSMFTARRRGDNKMASMVRTPDREVILAERSDQVRAFRTAAMHPALVFKDDNWAKYAPHLTQNEQVAVFRAALDERLKIMAPANSDGHRTAIARDRIDERICRVVGSRADMMHQMPGRSIRSSNLNEAIDNNGVYYGCLRSASKAAAASDWPETDKWNAQAEIYGVTRDAAIVRMLEGGPVLPELPDRSKA